ncbi:MAG: tripartite tricarboxylate transporter TctB family protein [Burkholderiaceae bacterium]
MSGPLAAPAQGRDPRRALLILLVLVATATALATPSLITPWPQDVAWYESPGTFPRFALALVVIGALAELLMRRGAERDADSDEMDASASRPGMMLAAAGLFIAYSLATPVLGFLSSTLLFALITARAAGLPWRTSAMLAVPLAVLLWVVFAKVLSIAFGGWL